MQWTDSKESSIEQQTTEQTDSIDRTHDFSTNRRRFLRGGVIGAVSVAGVSILGAVPADAASGDPVLIDRTTSGGGGVTLLQSTVLRASLEDTGGQVFNVKAYGALGNGSTDDSAAFATADALGGTVYVPPGSYVFASTKTLSADYLFTNGAQILPASGKTVAFMGTLSAPPRHIFAGSGSTAIGSRQSSVFIEWFGALSNGTNDDALALKAAVSALVNGGLIQLLSAPYTFKTNVNVMNHSITIQGTSRGVSPYDSGGGITAGTQILGINGTNCITATNVDYFSLRNVDVSLPSGASTASTAVTLSGCFLPVIEDVRTTNFSTGIHLLNCTDTYINRCYLSSTGSTVSPAVGIDIDGTTNQNASVYISNCIAAASSFSGAAYGYYLHGNRINDVTFDTCEADSVTTGFYINGSGVNAGYGGDIRCRGCVADGVSIGFQISACTVDSAITISDGWAATSSHGLYLDSGSTNVRVSNMQIYGATNGIYATGSGHSFQGNLVIYASQNGIYLGGSTFCNVSDNTFIQKSGTSLSGAAVNVSSHSNHAVVKGNICSGPTASFANGLTISAIDCDHFVSVGNIMPPSICTLPFTYNISANTNGTYLDGGGHLFVPGMSAGATGGSGVGRSSSTFAALTTACQVTLPVNTIVKVTVTGNLQSAGATGACYLGFAVSGNNTVVASTTNAIWYIAPFANDQGQYSGVFFLAGLTPGSSTLSLQYRGDGTNNATIINGQIIVECLD